MRVEGAATSAHAFNRLRDIAVTAPETDFDPYANSSLDDPYPHFAKLRDLGPVFFLSRYSAYGVARHAEVENVRLASLLTAF